ncbi:MAG TPA: hypothetical protein VE971_00245 [Candidatus Eisenbacteria bacterium]|nr:hypothetical protein [Candidatus Eisenbacteria bacterium]
MGLRLHVLIKVCLQSTNKIFLKSAMYSSGEIYPVWSIVPEDFGIIVKYVLNTDFGYEQFNTFRLEVIK